MTTPPPPPTPDSLDARVLLAKLAEFERRLEVQEAELQTLRGCVGDGPPPPPVPDHEPTPDRRRFVRAAAAAATGAVVGGATLLADANPAAANNGDAVLIGNNGNTGTQATGLAVNGNTALYGLGISDNGLGTITGFPAVFGHAKLINFFVGVLGIGESTATGVQGQAAGGNGVAGFALSGTGVLGSSSDGVGVRASGGRAALRLDRVNAAPPTRLDAHSTGEIDADTSEDVWLCVASGSPGTWRKLGGPGTAGALHVLPTTIRVYDSRPGFDPPGGTKGTLPASGQRVVDCKVDSAVPAGAIAVLANITVVSASGLGFLAAFRNGIAWPGNSTVNWDHVGQNIANSAVVALDANARFRVLASNPVDYIVDVVGYYR